LHARPDGFVVQTFKIFIFLELLQLLLAVVEDELLYCHETAAYSDNKIPVYNLSCDFLCAKVVLVFPDSGDWDRAVKAINVFCKEFVHLVPGNCLVELPRSFLKLCSRLLVGTLGFFDST